MFGCSCVCVSYARLLFVDHHVLERDGSVGLLIFNEREEGAHVVVFDNIEEHLELLGLLPANAFHLDDEHVAGHDLSGCAEPVLLCSAEPVSDRVIVNGGTRPAALDTSLGLSILDCARFYFEDLMGPVVVDDDCYHRVHSEKQQLQHLCAHFSREAEEFQGKRLLVKKDRQCIEFVPG